jgi:hypothetical protein
MRKSIYFAVLVGLFTVLVAPPGFAQQDPGSFVRDIERNRLAQTGMKFLSVSLDARAAALADAITAQEHASSVAMFYNPAALGRVSSTVDASVGQVQWIGEIDYNYATASYRPGEGLGVFGFSVVGVDYGTFNETIAFDNEDGYMDIGTYSPSGMAIGVGYGRAVSDRFSVGGHLRYVQQSLGNTVFGTTEGDGYSRREYTKGVGAADFGVIYQTGFRSLTFAMSVRNLAPEVTYEEENFELPLTFRVGLAMDMIDLTNLDPNMHSFLISVDAERPRDYSEQIKVGGEYLIFNTLALRAGYIVPTDEQGINAGVGVQQDVMGVDFRASYAFGQWNRFENVNRISVKLGI